MVEEATAIDGEVEEAVGEEVVVEVVGEEVVVVEEEVEADGDGEEEEVVVVEEAGINGVAAREVEEKEEESL